MYHYLKKLRVVDFENKINFITKLSFKKQTLGIFNNIVLNSLKTEQYPNLLPLNTDTEYIYGDCSKVFLIDPLIESAFVIREFFLFI